MEYEPVCLRLGPLGWECLTSIFFEVRRYWLFIEYCFCVSLIKLLPSCSFMLVSPCLPQFLSFGFAVITAAASVSEDFKTQNVSMGVTPPFILQTGELIEFTFSNQGHVLFL